MLQLPRVNRHLFDLLMIFPLETPSSEIVVLHAWYFHIRNYTLLSVLIVLLYIPITSTQGYPILFIFTSTDYILQLYNGIPAGMK